MILAQNLRNGFMVAVKWQLVDAPLVAYAV